MNDSIPGVILGGKPLFNDRSLYLFGQKHEGKKVDLKVRRSRRTLSQNSYLHLLFQLIADETGHSLEEVKTVEKRRHLPPVEIEMYGQRQLVLPSVSTLEKQAASGFIEKVEADCAMLGIELADEEALQAMGYFKKSR